MSNWAPSPSPVYRTSMNSAEPLRSEANKTLNKYVDKFKERGGNYERSQQQLVRKLPPWHEVIRAIPNHFSRSSLFAPIQKGKRVMHDKTKLVSRSDATIFYSGKQLDEADCDVFLQILHIARSVPLGQPLPINRAEFLRYIGRKKSGDAYKWLHQSFERLFLAAIQIEAKNYQIGHPVRGEALHLINSFRFDQALDQYVLSVDPRMLALFQNSEFSFLDWQKRMKIKKRSAISKFLQRLVATSKEKIQRYGLENLRRQACYDSPMRKFKEALLEAIGELIRVGVLASGWIEISTRRQEQITLTKFVRE